MSSLGSNENKASTAGAGTWAMIGKNETKANSFREFQNYYTLFKIIVDNFHLFVAKSVNKLYVFLKQSDI